MSDDHPSIVTSNDSPIDPPRTPRMSVDVIACGDCATLEIIDPVTLLASVTAQCACGCGWDEFVCQICGKPVGLRLVGW